MSFAFMAFFEFFFANIKKRRRMALLFLFVAKIFEGFGGLKKKKEWRQKIQKRSMYINF